MGGGQVEDRHRQTHEAEQGGFDDRHRGGADNGLIGTVVTNETASKKVPSFAYMRAKGIEEALAFDGDFAAAGFTELRYSQTTSTS